MLITDDCLKGQERTGAWTCQRTTIWGVEGSAAWGEAIPDEGSGSAQHTQRKDVQKKYLELWENSLTQYQSYLEEKTEKEWN